VLAAELATGEHPFGPDSAAMLRRMTELMEGRAGSGSGSWASRELEQIARRCLRASTAERYASGAELVAALRQMESGGAVSAPASASATLWWWQFHQVAIAAVLAALPAIAWSIRNEIGARAGSRIFFFAALVLATISITARMNLLFTSRVHPASLQRQRSLVFPWVPWIDAALALLMFAAALTLENQDAVAGFTIALATVIVASVTLIEPATTRAAGIGRSAAL